MRADLLTIAIEVRVAWWWSPYLDALAFFCGLMGAEPDWRRLSRVHEAAISFRVGGAPWLRLSRLRRICEERDDGNSTP